MTSEISLRYQLVEGTYTSGTEFLVALLIQDGEYLLHGHGGAVGPILGEGVEHVRDGQDARRHAQLFRHYAPVIARAV